MPTPIENFSQKQWLFEYQQLFTQQIQSSCLPHALLISGVTGSGKQTLATWLVNVLLCKQPSFISENRILKACGQCKSCHLYNSQTYPDQLTVSSETKSIGVEDIRKAGRFLEKTAQIGQVKTVMIPKAEKMTVAAANALLKTLEEPSASSILILLTSDADTLLPTVISRCRLIALRPPVGKALFEQIGQEQSSPYANLTQLPELLSDDIQQEYQHFYHLFIGYLSTNLGRIELLDQLKTSKHTLRWLEKIITNLMREQHQWGNSQELNDTQFSRSDEVPTLMTVKKINPNTLWQIYQHIQKCVHQLKSLTQTNAQLNYEKLLIDIKHAVDHT
jgi:DNA polymerase-3 subunit delta'